MAFAQSVLEQLGRPVLGIADRLRAIRERAIPPPDATLLRAEEIEPVGDLPIRPAAFLWRFVARRYLGRYAVMIALVLAAQACQTFEPYVLKQLINGLSAVPMIAAASALGLFALLAGLWIGDTILMRCYQAIDIYTAPYLREQVQNQMFGYLLGHSPRYFQDNFAGKLGQKIKESGRASLSIMEMLSFDATKLVVLLAVALCLLAAQDGHLALLLGAWSLAYVAASGLLALRCVRLSKAMSAAVSTSSGKLIDAISNADSIRSFAKWRFERVFLSRYFGEERVRSMRLRWFLILMRLFQATAVLSMLVTLVWLALADTLAGRMDVGSFAMVLTLASLISTNVWSLSNRMLDFFDAWGTLSEAIELVTQPHEIVDHAEARPLVVRRGAIDFERVSYSHPNGQPLFDALDLAIGAGEKVALVGPSGAGKSTLVKLIRRQFEPQSGRILIDGQDIAAVTWDSLNDAIAEVSQAPGIFHRPVGENIRYGRLEAGDAELRQAAMRAHCHEFILKRPTGYMTIVGEQGIKLSGGERQRVAIARALLKDSRILVLDEATSALDSESEHLIQEALWELMRSRTVIAIAHRLSTIKGMDRIVYLQEGAILEQGSHAELVMRAGAYARLWNRQVGGFIGAA